MMDESKSASQNVEKLMVSACTQPALAIAQGHSSEALWNQYVQRATDGDHDALASFYDETSSLVYSLALRILGDPADAEEVTLDVYTQVWRSAKNFDAQLGTITAWLVTLTRSRAIDRLRSVAARSRHLPEFPEMAASPENPEQATVLSQQRRLVRAALDVLPAEQRQAIEMAFFSGLSHSELATKLGLPLGTAKTRIRLGMMKLRELLGAGA